MLLSQWSLRAGLLLSDMLGITPILLGFQPLRVPPLPAELRVAFRLPLLARKALNNPGLPASPASSPHTLLYIERCSSHNTVL